MYDQNWIEKNLKNPVFQTAFTHRSYLNEVSDQIESNERLEFLGDAVLSLVVSSYLFDQRVKDTEGDLTNLRSYIVKTQSLARASKQLNLGKFLRMSKGEEMSGGRNNTQLLANTFESLLGAIYQVFGIEEAKKFVFEVLIPIFKEEIKSGPPKDAKSLLQELAQNQTKKSPDYKILETKGPDHAKQFKVGVFVEGKQIGIGVGLSKQIAEEAAAKVALEHFPSTD